MQIIFSRITRILYNFILSQITQITQNLCYFILSRITRISQILCNLSTHRFFAIYQLTVSLQFIYSQNLCYFILSRITQITQILLRQCSTQCGFGGGLFGRQQSTDKRHNAVAGAAFMAVSGQRTSSIISRHWGVKVSGRWGGPCGPRKRQHSA